MQHVAASCIFYSNQERYTERKVTTTIGNLKVVQRKTYYACATPQQPHTAAATATAVVHSFSCRIHRSYNDSDSDSPSGSAILFANSTAFRRKLGRWHIPHKLHCCSSTYVRPFLVAPIAFVARYSIFCLLLSSSTAAIIVVVVVVVVVAFATSCRSDQIQ